MVGGGGGGGAYGVAISLVHIFAVVSHVLVNRDLLTAFNFQYPVTLTVLQYLSISVSLSFWTVFGIVRLRRVPLWGAIRLAVGAALCSALSNLSLRYNSLAAFQAARLTAAPAVLGVRCLLGGRGNENDRTPRRPFLTAFSGITICIAACGVWWMDKQSNRLGGVWALLGVATTAFYQELSFNLRLTTKANELQLQLVTKTLGALFLSFLAPLLDDFRINSESSILRLELDETTSLMLLLSAFLAFLSFVAQRACVSTHQTRGYNVLAYAVSVLIFCAHFVPALSNVDKRLHAAKQLPFVTAVMLSTVLFASARGNSFYQRRSVVDFHNALSHFTRTVQTSRPTVLATLTRAARNPTLNLRRQRPERPTFNMASHERQRSSNTSRPSQSEPDILQRINEA